MGQQYLEYGYWSWEEHQWDAVCRRRRSRSTKKKGQRSWEEEVSGA
jgi:hypothetical protein